MWSAAQLKEYGDQGFLYQPGLFDSEEIADLHATTLALASGVAEMQEVHVVREKSGPVRSMFRMHHKVEKFRRLIRDPRLAGPCKQILGEDAYVYHSKINFKDAFEGGVWLMHQDYGYWQFDGVDDRIMSALVMLDETTLYNGCMFFVAGSHRWGMLDHYSDEVTTNYKQWCIKPEALKEQIKDECMYVPVIGKPGDAYFFDSKIIHGSGHNLSPLPRRTLIFAIAALSNKPHGVTNPRPAWVVEREFEPVTEAVELVASA